MTKLAISRIPLALNYILIIDNFPIRALAFAQVEQTIRKLDDLEARIGSFADEQRQFETWSKATFASHYAEIGRLHEKLQRFQKFHNWAFAISRMKGISFVFGYQEVLREESRYKKGTPLIRELIEKRRREREEFLSQRQESEADADGEAEREARELEHDMAFEDPDLTDSELPSDETQSHDGRPEGERAESLRRTYHRLVRALHPDLHLEDDGLAAWRAKMWLRGQAAFRAQDEMELENLFVLCHLRGHNFEDLSLSDIRLGQARLKEELESLNRQVRQLKKSPAWGFLQRQTHKTLLRQMEKQVAAEKKGVLEEIKELEGQHMLVEMLTRTERRKGTN